MPWDRSIESALVEIKNEFETDIKDIAFYAFSRAQAISPVGNPLLWANPKSAPKGYRGGRFKQSWQIDQQGKKWIISNPLPYAQRLDDGHSTQAPNGLLDVIISDLSAFK